MRFFAVSVVVLTIGQIVPAQDRPKSFEVASVKRPDINQYSPPIITPQTFYIRATLLEAIEWAYDVRQYQISGGPPWIDRSYFQIQATTPTPATPADMRAMLQRLLADRFKVTLHREAPQRPVYFLVTAASRSRLSVSTEACGSDGCINVAPGEFWARGASMASTAVILSNLVGRPVLDRTGLTARYDFRMFFDPTSMPNYAGQPTPRVGPDSPSIFAALQDLGLKLEPQRAPIDTLVIDGAQEPSLD